MTGYIIKSSVSLLLMFGLYWFLLRNEKLFVFNRFFLVLSVVFSLAVPFISVPVNFGATPRLNDIIPAYDYVIPEIRTTDNIVPGDVNISQSYVEKEMTVIGISALLRALYVSGLILFLIRFLRNIYFIIQRSKLSEVISLKGYRIVLTNDRVGPCCFFKSVFLNSEDYLKGRIDKEVLAHELEHARQSHTIDIMLIDRHPHIFGDVKVTDAKNVKDNWEKIKLTEAGNKSVLSGVPNSLSSLVKAYRIQEKASGVGFDWESTEDVWAKVLEEMNELKDVLVNGNDPEKKEEEVGDLFFALINYARFINVNPDDALERTNLKFIKRFQYIEEQAKKSNKALNEMTLEEMERFWVEAKNLGRNSVL